MTAPTRTARPSADAYGYAVGTKAITRRGIDFEKARPVDKTTYESWIERLEPTAGDLILCREAPVGPVAVVPAEPRVCLGQRTVLLRPDPERVDSRYLHAALLDDSAQHRLNEVADGSTVPHLNVRDIRTFILRVPPLADQRRIAGVLAALDEKLESNWRIARTLEGAVSTLFRARFVAFVQHGDLVESEIGLIPRGWSVATLADLATPHRDLAKGEKQLPYIGLDAMPRGSTILRSWLEETAPTGQAARFEQGDILLGKLRPYFRKVGVAPVRGRCSTEILVLRPAEPAFYGLLLGHVSSQRFIDHCVAVSRGTKMPRAEWKDAGTFGVAVPPLDQAAEFTQAAHAAYAKIISLTHASRTLLELRDALLPRLLSGELFDNRAGSVVAEAL